MSNANFMSANSLTFSRAECPSQWHRKSQIPDAFFWPCDHGTTTILLPLLFDGDPARLK